MPPSHHAPNPDERSRALELQAQAALDPSEAASLLCQAADVLIQRSRELDRAQALLQRAAAIDPEAIEPLKRLRVLYEQNQSLAPLAEVLERLAQRTGGAEAATLLHRAAELHDRPLRHPHRAVLCLQLALRADPKRREVIRRVRSVLLKDGRPLSAFESLERERALFGDAGMATEYAALAELLLEDPPSHDLAQRALERAIVLEPGNTVAQKLKKALANYKLTWRDRVRTLRSQSLETQDRQEAARLSLQVAKLFARYEPNARGKVNEALERSFLLWPGMPEAAAFVELVAHQDGDFARAAARLEELAGVTTDLTAKVDLWIRAGTLRLSRLSEPERALADFRQAQLVDPTRTDATSLAVELAIELSNPAGAAELLEAHLAVVTDVAAAVALRRPLAGRYAGPLKAVPRARGHLEAALQAAPGELAVARQLAQLAVEAQDAAALAPLLPALDLPGPWKAAELLLRCAAVFEGAGDLPLAAQALARALVHEPARVELLPRLLDAAKATSSVEPLALCLRRAAALAPGDASSALWRTLAELLGRFPDRAVEAEAARREAEKREKPLPPAPIPPDSPTGPAQLRAALEALGPTPRPDDALPLQRQLSEAAPADVTVARQLALTLATLARWEELAALTGRVAHHTEGGEHVEWTLRQARLFADRLGRADDAAALLLPLTHLDPLPAGLLQELERLAASGVRRAEIQTALLPHYARGGDEQGEAADLLFKLGATQEAALQKPLLLRLAALQETTLRDAPAALGSLTRALALAPEDTALADRCWELARRAGALLPLARGFADAAGQQSEPGRRAQLFDRASAAAVEAGADDDAGRWVEASLAAKEEPATLDRAVEILLRLSRPDEAERKLRRRLLLADTPEKRALYLRLAELNQKLDRPGDAAAALEEAIRAGEEERPHLQRLCDLYARAGRPEAYAPVMRRRIALAREGGDEGAAAALEEALRATVEAERAKETPGVEEALARVGRGAADPDALAALERALQDDGHRLKAARALRIALAGRDASRELPALEVIAERGESHDERLTALKELAELHTQVAQPDQALLTLARALRLSPQDAGLLHAALDAAIAADQLEALRELFLELLKTPSAESSALHLAQAQALERLGEPRAEVLRHLHAAKALDTGNVEVLQTLVLQHRAHDEWAALAELLETLAQVTLRPEEKLARWREAALLHEHRLLDKESAAVAWRQVAEQRPMDADAVLALERLYVELDRPQDLVFALELGRKQHAGTARGRELTVRLAQLKANRLGELTDAVALCEEVLAEDAAHPAARDALEGWVSRKESAGAKALALLDPLLAQAQDHGRRAALREARLAVAVADAERERLSAELRGLYERELQQPERAFMAALRAFSAGLGRDALIDELERLARITGLPEEVAEIYEGAADQLLPGDPQLPRLLRKAAAYREELGAFEAATRLWNELLGELPSDAEALEHLSALYARTQNAQNLAEVYARQAAIATGSTQRRELLLRSARAYEDAGGDEPAIEALRGALALGKTPDVLASLDRLYGRTKRGPDQAEVLAALVEATTDAGEQFGLRVRLGPLYEKLGKAEEAGAAYLAALRDAPAGRPEAAFDGALARLHRLFVEGGAAPAGALLERLHRERADRRPLAEVLERQAEASPSLAGFAEIAALREALGERLAAFASRLRGFALAPADEGNRQELERLARELDSPDELIAAYEDRLERGTEPEVAARLWRRLGELQEDLGRSEPAARAWEEHARRTPTAIEPLRRLAGLHQRAMAFRELTDVLLRQVALEGSDERKVDLLYEAATVAEDSLGDAAVAIRCYRDLLARAPQEATARRSLERLLTAQGDHAGLADQLNQELLALPASEEDKGAELRLSLARLKLTRLAAPREALMLLEQVLDTAPQHAGVAPALQALLEHPEVSARAAQLLDGLLAQNPDASQRVGLLESQLATERDRARRAALLRRMAEEQAGPLGEPELAFLSAARALRETPEDAACVELCLRTAVAAEAQDGLDALLSELASASPEARLLLTRTQARLRAGSREGAAAAWREVLTLAPQDPEALDALERTLREADRQDELVWLLQQRLQAARAPGVAAELQLKIAAAQETRGELAQAVASLQQSFALEPATAPLVALERLYGKLNQGRERAEVLSRLAERTGEPAAAAALLLQRAAVLESLNELDAATVAYGELLEEPAAADAAMARLERLLGHPSVGLRAALLLEPALRTRGDLKRLVAVLEVRLPSAGKETRKALLEEVARLREEVGQTSLAFAARSRALIDAPTDDLVRAEMERLATASGLLEELAATYEDLLERACPEPLRLTLRRRLAELYTGPLARPSVAVAQWEEVARQNPSDAQAMAALADIYRKANAHERLVEILLRQVDAEPVGDRQVERLFEVAELAEGTLCDDELAISAYQQILDRAPSERGALRSLQHAYERTLRFEELADALHREVALLRAAHEEAAALDRQVALGQLQADRLNDPQGALATLGAVLALAPEHAGAQDALEALALGGGPVCVEAARLIEPVFEQHGANARLVSVLEAHARAEEAPASRAGLLRWVAGLQATTLKDPEAAFLAAARALREAPDDASSLELCLTLVKGADGAEELTTLLEELAPLAGDPTARRRLLQTLAQLQTDQDESDAAIASWRGVLTLRPENLDALEALERLYASTRRFEALTELLTSRILTAHGEVRVHLLCRRAEVQEQAGDEAGAVSSLAEACELDGGRERLLALDRLLERTGQKRQRAELLARLGELPECGGEERRDLSLSRAKLLEEIDELPDATQVYARVLADWPEHGPALLALRRLLTVPGARAHAATVLEPLARRRAQEDPAFLLQVLEARGEHPNAEEAAGVLDELARLHERRGDLRTAFARRLRLFRAQPGDGENRAALERLADALQGHEELAGAYEDEAERNPNVPSGVLSRLARLYESALGDGAAAARFWERLTSREDDAREALTALLPLYRSLHSPAALAGALERATAAEKNVEVKLAHLRELGAVAEEELTDLDRAASAYQQLLALTPEDAPARSALGRLLTLTGRYPQLAELVEAEMASAAQRGDDAALNDQRVRQARLQSGHLGNPTRALELLRAVVGSAPRHEDALAALEELLGADGPSPAAAADVLGPLLDETSASDAARLARVLEVQAAAATEPPQKAGFLRRLAQLQRDVLQDLPAAYRVGCAALSAHPEDEAALTLVLELSRKAGRDDETARLLAALVTDREPRSRLPLRRARARLLEALWKPDEAGAAWRELLQGDPGDAEALEGLARSLEAHGASQALLDVRRRQLSLAQSPAERAPLLLRQSALQQQLGDDEGALANLRKVLELDEQNAQALEQADRLSDRLMRWPELSGVLERRLRLPASAEEKSALRFRLAELRELKLENRTGSLPLYRQLLLEVPGHSGALARLEGLSSREPKNAALLDALIDAYRAAQQHAKLASKLEARAALSADPAERKRLYAELAEVRAGPLAEPELAFLSLSRAFAEDPCDDALRARLRGAAEKADAVDALAALYEQELPRVQPAERTAAVHLELGRHHAEADPARAAPHLKAALGVPGAAAEPEVLALLERVHAALGAHEALAEVLQRRAELETQGAARAELWVQLAQLQAGPLAAPGKAAATLERVLALSPEHPVAAERLEGLYAQTGQAQKRIAILELRVRLATGEAQDAVTLSLGAALADAGELDRAIALYRQLLERAGRNPSAFDALTATLERSGRLEALREALVDRISRTVDPGELAQLHARVGTLLHRGLARPEDAIAHLKAAVERAPQQVELLEELQAVYERLGRHDDLAEILRKRIGGSTSTAEQRPLRLSLAEALATLERPEEALEAAAPVLKAYVASVEDPSLRVTAEVAQPTTEELKRLEAEDPAARVTAEHDTQGLAGAPAEVRRLHALYRRLDARIERAQLLQARGEQLAATDLQAASAQLHDAAALWMESEEPLRAAPLLRRLLTLSPTDARAYEASRALYSTQARWPELAGLISDRLPHLPPEDQRLALLELADLQESRLSQGAEAVAALCRAVALKPDDVPLRARVEALAATHGATAPVAAAYEELVALLPWGPTAEQLLRTLAQLYDGPLDDVARAEAALRRVLDSEPGSDAALESLQQLFSRRGMLERSVEVLEQKLEVTGELAARKRILQQIATVYEEQLKDPARAVATLERSLQLATDATTYEGLIALHRRGGRWPEVVSALGRARDFAVRGEQRAVFEVQIAAVQEQQLKDVSAAVASLRQALEHDGANADAFAQLERLYTTLDKPLELLALLERQLARTDAREERISLLRRCAELCEARQKNLAAAVRHLEQLVLLSPQDLDALRALTRLKRALGRPAELTLHIERVLPLVPKPEQLELLLESAELFATSLQQGDRALATYGRALELEPRHRGALWASAELHERARAWPSALDFLQREARVIGAVPEGADLQCRMGRILDAELKDRTKAKNAYQEALRLHGAHAGATDALLRIYQEEGNWGMYERTLAHRAQHSDPGAPKAKALVAVGRFFLERRKDREGARGWFEQAIRADPQCVEAAAALAEIYIATEDWLAAERMLDVVVRDLTARAGPTPTGADAQTLCAQLTRLGEISQRLGEQPKALRSLELALALNPTYLPALRGLGALRVSLRQPAEALKIFESLLLHHRSALTPREVAELHVRVGELHASLAQRARARTEFERALGLDSRLAPALRGLAALHDEQGEHDRALEVRQRLLPLSEGDAKYALCLEIAALAKEKVRNPTLTVEALQQALKIKPDSVEALDRLYVAYRTSHQGARAAEVLQTLLRAPALQGDPTRQKAVQVSLAETYRDELRDLDRAAAAYNAALDLDWRFVAALRGLEKLYTQAKRWKELEEVYTRMIRRIPESPETLSARMTLWRTLGDLQLKGLGQPDRALESYQVVCRGTPDDSEAQEQLATLAAQRPGMEEAAAEAFRRALPATANPAAVCVGFAELEAKRKRYDSAYLAALAATGLLDTSGPGELEILAKLTIFARRTEVSPAHLTDRLWKSHLLHPCTRGPLAELMALLAEQLSDTLAVPLSKYDLHPKKHRVELATAADPALRALGYAASVLGLALPELYSSFLATRERSGKKGGSGVFSDVLVGLELCNTHPPALRVGGRFFGETGQKELLYLCGRSLAALRPELQLVHRVEPPRLPQLIQAAVWLSGMTPPGDVRLLEKERRFLEKSLSDSGRAALHRVGRDAASALADPQALPRYVEGVELTAMRAGALLAAEPQAIKRVVLSEAGRIGDKAKLRDLLVFFLSEDLLVLRQALGLTVDPLKG